jgi:hypothetical protein
MASSTPSDEKLTTAKNALETAKELAKIYWRYGSNTRTSKGAWAYYRVLAKGIAVMDSEWKAPDVVDYAALIEVHTRLAWVYSQWNAQEAVTYYEAFVTSLYQYDVHVGKELPDKIQEVQRRNFEEAAIKATNNNDAWKYITREPNPRSKIMEIALTVTTMMIGHDTVDSEYYKDRSTRLWEQREIANL